MITDEERVRKLYEEARRVWPDIDVPEKLFTERLARFSGGSDEAGLHTGDLYMALACELNVEGALRHFEAAYLKDLGGLLRRHRISSITPDDLKQLVRQRLLLAERGERPRVADYEGRGSLAGWVRVAATRIVLNLAKQERHGSSLEGEEAMLQVPDRAIGVDAQFAKREFAEHLRRAFPVAFAALEVKQRLLLRQRYLDGLSLEELAHLHLVHLATVKRQLAAAREDLGAHVRRLLAQSTKLSEDEIARAVRSVESQVRLSLERYLPANEDASSA